MPKHGKKSTAARLPKSRLPVGAHLPDNTTRPTSRATNRSTTDSSFISRADTASSTEDGITILTPPTPKPPTPAKSVATAMSTSAYSDHGGGVALSTAEAKLRRQNERIQQAEAALAAPPHSNNQRPVSRDKNSNKPAHKKMPIGWDIAGQHPDAEDRVLATATERRINTFYPSLSRDTSLSRSISGISNMAGTYDMERHDSMLVDQGFQYPRRGKPSADQLRPYEDKPEVKQKTVEATIDKDEIHKVFGIDLPPLEFLRMNPGYNDAQLQFVMHPNGDVGAHMWSMNRYVWENIGIFSNIRKKVEGQLGSDRLKGETAWQTLQKNTLAYFRAISKQREQTTMGQPFGQQEIQQIMGPPPEQPATATIEKAESPKPRFFTTTGNRVGVQVDAQRQREENAIRQQAIANTHGAVRILPQRDLPVAVPAGPRLSHPNQYSYNPPPRPELRNEDPFTVPVPHPTYGVFSEPPLSAPAGNFQPTGTAQTFGGARNEYVPPHWRPSASRPARMAGTGGANAASTTAAPTVHPSMLQPYLAGTAATPIQRQLSLGSVGTPSCPKPVTPMHSREAMRDQLRKLGETAKERSTSQNGRTILYDPFSSLGDKVDGEEPFPDFNQSLAITAPQKDQNEREFKPAFDTRFGGWRDSQPMLPTPQRRLASLGDSVPDTDFPQSSSETRATSGTYSVLRPSHASEDVGAMNVFAPPAAKVKKLSPEAELKEWYFSTSKLARQEEFFQSIKTLSLKSEPDSPMSTRTPSRLAHIGARSAKVSPRSRTTAPAVNGNTSKSQVPWDEGLTRSLIPVYESLAAYVEGPIEKRRDYFSNWSKPPEWAIDRGPNGNNSFFDNTWGQPPARLSRDSRYRSIAADSPRSRYPGGGGGYTTGGVPLSSLPAVSGGLPGMSTGRFEFGGSTY
ncbi:hypothetical protein CLAFUW4_14281 [Fulvia fulva]|uniref:Uncharacterized protein n=1 Tax=Passalora fulva TaxID=5499 RepID=A0A9Q8UWK6_PASFU|nr:uncharacterized protein CLAFUR5_14114 [Fulvia fulva]KAK4609219.1 hypothetical protein CLAFUR4_14281 [Fulvia fulva]KAK4609737.1 hypothetical protein CLAFUR0_14285 [Fulvia fulva]UJO25002.1 hypothetical protein CLAFUR5_14114 [Fulvia fulva]WPV22908.1 hypothetical protein CLAFUW4_14281 [Fulvia fulva]WPV37433.1 hypothetical protein CLAFUW7_14289 [Fulvia fulva]